MSEIIRVADYIVRFIEQLGVKDIFLVSGGGVMHIIDAVGRNKNIRYICNHHEQACTIAVEGYARFKNDIGAAIVTTGPGGTNAITGVAGCWLDSIPSITISGQVKLADTIYTCNPGLRQFGDQEINIIDIIKPITKYSVMITDKNTIKYHLEKAVYMAKSGRPGPVWIDVPLNIQGDSVDLDELIGFTPEPVELPKLDKTIEDVINKLQNAKRPLLMVGNGVRLAGAASELLKLLEIMQIPVITAINGNDLVTDEFKYYTGRSGIAGQRGGNFAMQNCDVILSIGSRLMLRQIGFDYENFAHNAYKIIVDIDETELNKKSIKPDMAICCDAKYFIDNLMDKIVVNGGLNTNCEEWKKKCMYWQEKYNKIDQYHVEQEDYINAYYFIDKLYERFERDDHIVTTNGTAYIAALQALRIKQGQRMIYNKALAAMGYGLPAAIGACIANDRKKILCFENDGSLQMNIQELQTVVHHKLPIKMVVFNNDGYLSIKITQMNFFPDNICASDPSSGVSLPDLQKIAAAYGIPFNRINNKDEINEKLDEMFQNEGMFICEVMMDPWQPMIPKTSSEKLPDGTMISKPIDDMFPFLSKEEYLENIVESYIE